MRRERRTGRRLRGHGGHELGKLRVVHVAIQDRDIFGDIGPKLDDLFLRIGRCGREPGVRASFLVLEGVPAAARRHIQSNRHHSQGAPTLADFRKGKPVDVERNLEERRRGDEPADQPCVAGRVCAQAVGVEPPSRAAREAAGVILAAVVVAQRTAVRRLELNADKALFRVVNGHCDVSLLHLRPWETGRQRVRSTEQDA